MRVNHNNRLHMGSTKEDRTAPFPNRDVLVAIVNEWDALNRVLAGSWYRVPVKTAPRDWPPTWLAFYQTREFGDEAYQVKYYGEVANIEVIPRHDLLPNEFPNSKSDDLYYCVWLKEVKDLKPSIYSTRPRRLVFVPTTWQKFSTARIINDLFADSPMEDILWQGLKQKHIDAERQWEVKLKRAVYQLDFAVFCRDGRIDVEVDGDRWHHNAVRAPRDNVRNNALTTVGWEVLRFTGHQIRESLNTYCIREIAKTVTRLGGPSSKGVISRKVIGTTDGTAVQFSMFDNNSGDSGK
jgi:very-short-patch-repair endonuclease